MTNKLKPVKQKIAKSNKKHPIEFIEIHGNNGANYIKFGKYSGESNLIYLEVGDCCVITFRGVVTAEMFSAFLTHHDCLDNAGLIDNMKKSMQWGDQVNEEFSKGCCEIDFWGNEIPRN